MSRILRVSEDISSLIRWLTRTVFAEDNILLDLGNNRVVKWPLFSIDATERDVTFLSPWSNVTHDRRQSIPYLPAIRMGAVGHLTLPSNWSPRVCFDKKLPLSFFLFMSPSSINNWNICSNQTIVERNNLEFQDLRLIILFVGLKNRRFWARRRSQRAWLYIYISYFLWQLKTTYPLK
jgi:hypothetical protein